MPPWFNHHEGLAQLLFGVTAQDFFQFGVNRIDCRRFDAEINDTAAFLPDKNQIAEIAITRDEDALFPLRGGQQFRVVGP